MVSVRRLSLRICKFVCCQHERLSASPGTTTTCPETWDVCAKPWEEPRRTANPLNSRKYLIDESKCVAKRGETWLYFSVPQ
jgi:hypothetical protein